MDYVQELWIITLFYLFVGGAFLGQSVEKPSQ